MNIFLLVTTQVRKDIDTMDYGSIQYHKTNELQIALTSMLLQYYELVHHPI